MVDLHLHSWLPDSPIKAVVVIVHGIGEHGGRYNHVAHYLNAQGFAAYAPDHYGHGKSGGPRCYFESMEQPSDDLAVTIEHIRADHPDKLLFVYGHSMGSLITLRYALGHQDQLAGLIISGTPLHTDQLYPPPLRAVAPWANRVAPTAPVIPFDVKGVSRDPVVVKAALEDPLSYHGLIRLRMAYFIFAESLYIRERLDQLYVPLLILHGEADPICPVSGSHFLHDHAQSADKTLITYPGLYHEVHNEPEQNTVFEDVVNWLNQRIAL